MIVASRAMTDHSTIGHEQPTLMGKVLSTPHQLGSLDLEHVANNLEVEGMCHTVPHKRLESSRASLEPAQYYGIVRPHIYVFSSKLKQLLDKP